MENKTWGDYELLGVIGKGAQGVVYKARQPLLDRLVAIKVLPTYHVSDESFVARFTREAQNIARLSHPNIVHVYDMNRHEGTYYYVMEYIEGEDLGKVLKRGDRLTFDRVIDIVKQVASALVAANEHNMAHRDIKPENILLTTKGQVKVADFGLAKITGGGSNVTREGMILGTVNYMSPEQAKGQECDVRSDMYSLGIVMFRMLTGVLPFKGENLQAIIYQHIHEAPPDPLAVNPNIPAPLSRVCLKLLEKQPEKRYQSPVELIRILDALSAHVKGTDSMTTAEISRLLGESASPEDATLGASAETLSLYSKQVAQKPKKLSLAMIVPIVFVLLLALAFGVDKFALKGQMYNSIFGTKPVLTAEPFPFESGTSGSQQPLNGQTPVTSTKPSLVAKVNLALSPSESTLEISRDGQPVAFTPPDQGLVTLSLAPGTYKVMVRCPGFMIREAVISVDSSGKVTPADDPIAFVLHLTPERQAEEDLQKEYGELNTSDEYAKFFERLKIEADKFPQSKTLQNLLGFTTKRLNEFAAKLLEEALNSISAKTDLVARKQFDQLATIKFDEDRAKIEQSLKYSENPLARTTLEQINVMERALATFIEAEAEAKKALEENNAESLMKAVGLYEVFRDKYSDLRMMKQLNERSDERLAELRSRQSAEQAFESWAKRMQNLCDSIEESIRTSDFEAARNTLISATEALKAKPVVEATPQNLIELSQAFERKITQEYPESIEKGLRNRKEVVWKAIKDFEAALNAKSIETVAGFLADVQEKQDWIEQLKVFFSSPYVKSSSFDMIGADTISIENDSVSLTIAWTLNLQIFGADGKSIEVEEKALLHIGMSYKQDQWRFVELKATPEK